MVLNPHWHDLRKQEKMLIFSATKNIWKCLIKIQLTKSDQKRTRGCKVPCLMPIRVKSNLKQGLNTLVHFFFECLVLACSDVLMLKNYNHGRFGINEEWHIWTSTWTLKILLAKMASSEAIFSLCIRVPMNS